METTKQTRLPSGTVTFLFTDLEGSTRLWEKQPAAMRTAMARHDELLKGAVTGHDGVIVKMRGDGIHAAFASAVDAARAALAAQQELFNEPWDEEIGPLRVRMALHTGTAEQRDGDYYGSEVNRAARLLPLGHGGQTLLSESVEALIRDELPDKATLVDLGEHQLEDLSRPEHIYQLSHLDLPAQFPPLKSRSVRYRLPTQLTSFVGRDEELAEIVELIRNPLCRLLTLVGPGGIGKTRLALQVAEQIGDEFEHGAVFVPLQPVSAAELLWTAVADALHYPLSGSASPEVQVLHYLANKALLLLFDNFEHLLDAADTLTSLLQAAPDVKLLVTSRAALKLQEEWFYPVGGLPYPGLATYRAPGEKGAEDYPAVQLFAERARRVQPDFDLAAELGDVVRICQLVEGMPLAIELAAAWTHTLSCAEIVSEIERSLSFLTTNMRNVPERHRSMQAVFEQSLQQLSDQERDVFKRLSVFQGGFQRRAAQAVTGASIVILASLVDKALLRWEPAEGRRSQQGRYHIHELLRQFAAEQLARSPEDVEEMRARHCLYYATFLMERDEGLKGGRQLETLSEIEEALENIRAAWKWAVEHEKVDELARSANTLSLFYQYRSRYLEGLQTAEEAIQALGQSESTRQRERLLAVLLVSAAWYYVRFGRLEEAEAAALQSQAIYERLGEPLGSGFSSDPLLVLGIIASVRGDYPKAIELGEQSYKINKEQGHLSNLQLASYLIAGAKITRGEYEEGRACAQEAYTIAERIGDDWFKAYALNALGNVKLALGDISAAKEHYERSFELRQAFNDPEGMAVALSHQGKVALRQKDPATACHFYQRAASIYSEIDDTGGLARSYLGLGVAAVDRGDQPAAWRHFRRSLQLATYIGYTPVILALFVSIGELFLQAGREQRGVELLSLVRHHPSSSGWQQQRAEELLDNLHVEEGNAQAATPQHEAIDLMGLAMAVQNEMAQEL